MATGLRGPLSAPGGWTGGGGCGVLRAALEAQPASVAGALGRALVSEALGVTGSQDCSVACPEGAPVPSANPSQGQAAGTSQPGLWVVKVGVGREGVGTPLSSSPTHHFPSSPSSPLFQELSGKKEKNLGQYDLIWALSICV